MPNNFSLRSERAVESPFPSEKEEQADDIERVLNSMSRMLQTTWTDADVHLVGPGTFKGHEDLDQIFSQQAAMLARHEFATPDDVVALMDDTFKPESAADEIRKQSRRVKVESYARKLDQAVAGDWAPPGRFRVFQLVASAEESDDDVPEDAIVLDDDRD
ncbi:unnamed protein product [Durusdinium trenchii]|uniref:Uncharacterized protein n=1 Tax=Durusdinium trenchii TaxID=1381693 RepID=A0ABP0SZN3_9DINO